jgi:16S rRNA G966 N2-methylase RsmD
MGGLMPLQNDVSPKDEKEQRLKWITTQVRLGDIKPYEHNPRFITVERWKLLLDQMQKHGYASLIQIDTDMTIISGHQRVKAFYEEYGWNDDEIVEVRMPERKLTEREFKEHLLACNKTAGEFDYDMLAGSFPEDIMKAAGFTDEEMGKIDELNSIDELDGDEQDDAVPEVSKKIIAVEGDVFELGNHRLMCGNSTSKKDVSILITGNKIDVVYTDPPYGANFVRNRGSVKNGVKGKSIGGDGNIYSEMIGDKTTDTAKDSYDICISLCGNLIFWGAQYYAEHFPPSPGWIVWDKDTTGDHGDGELAWTSFEKPVRIFKHQWNGMIKESEMGEKRCHPTQKPIALAEWCIEKYAPDSNRVLDLFGGSGSTLIACEKLNKQCFMMELDPQYCDVIIRRYIDFMKKNDRPVKLQRNGEIISTEIFEAKV